jgi:hypothetical protein
MKEVIFSEKHIACAAFQFESSDQIMGLRCVDFQASKTTQKDIGEFTARFVLEFGRISSRRSGFIYSAGRTDRAPMSQSVAHF